MNQHNNNQSRYWQNWDQGNIAQEIDDGWRTSKLESDWREILGADLEATLDTNATVVEVGCGSGLVYDTMASRHIVTPNSYTGGDVSVKLLDIAHRHFPDVHFMPLDIFALPYNDNSQPNVLCISVLQHLPGYEKALRELLRITAGKLYITTWFTKIGQDKIRLSPDKSGIKFYQNVYSLQRFISYVSTFERIKRIDTQCLISFRWSLTRHGLHKPPSTFRILIEK